MVLPDSSLLCAVIFLGGFPLVFPRRPWRGKRKGLEYRINLFKERKVKLLWLKDC